MQRAEDAPLALTVVSRVMTSVTAGQPDPAGISVPPLQASVKSPASSKSTHWITPGRAHFEANLKAVMPASVQVLSGVRYSHRPAFALLF